MKDSNLHLDSIAYAKDLVKEVKIKLCKEVPMQSIDQILFYKLDSNKYFKINDDHSKVVARVARKNPKAKVFVYASDYLVKIFKNLEDIPDDVETIGKEYSEDYTSNVFRVLYIQSLNLVSGKQGFSHIPYNYDDKGLPSFENISTHYTDDDLKPGTLLYELPEKEINSNEIGIAFADFFERMQKSENLK